ncbi:hypothetical protein DM02DRAFT_666546 [Periconia macrospinosa]|uniref:Uncharacterized protein n=1 Tax=Periconia macrospinosa TaxID=97972 RepID=A0A2V1ED75_9PLEO|nr:hypothetical protein DM02DRAFT_666546 [Periconia macrospinosa]
MVQWTAEKDQILLKGVFQFNDIKFSQPLLKHLAELIGDECTPKAVSHRLNNIKNSGKPAKSATDGATASPIKKTPTKKGTAAPATPRSNKSAKSTAAKKKAIEAGEDGQGAAEDSPTPTARKRGRPKKSNATVSEEDEGEAAGEDETEEKSEYFDAEPEAKKIKLEKEDELEPDFDTVM